MTSSAPDPRARLAAALSKLRAQVGNPSYAAMAKTLAGHRQTHAVGETSLRNAATADEPAPKWTTVAQFVMACRLIAARDRPGIDNRFFDPESWYARWKALGQTETSDDQDLLAAWKTDAGVGPQTVVTASWAGLVVALDEAGQLLRVSAMDPYRLGATESRYGGHDRYDHTERGKAADLYVRRRIDTEVEAAVGERRLTVVIGPSKAGKTRTLFEALARSRPDARVLVPAREKLDALPIHPAYTDSPYPIVVWLDDLHRYLTSTSGLTPGLLAHLLARPAPTTVLATLRREEHDRFHDVKKGELAGDVAELLRQATLIELESTLIDPSEQTAAEAAYPDAHLEHYRALGYGLGEVLAGAPAALELYDRAARTDPPLRAVLETAIDWARIGRLDPIPESTLTDLATTALRRNRPEYDCDPATLAAAVRAARTRVEAHAHIAALTTRSLDEHSDALGYLAFDYLVAADDGQHNRIPRPIPEPFWRIATYNASTNTLTRVGAHAYLRGYFDTARELTRKAADTGNIDAMNNLGFLLRERGEVGEAETLWHEAVDAGNTAAMNNLGGLFRERGELAKAENWYRRAADTGRIDAMYNLGVLLRDNGELAKAETWWRRAADTGNTAAMISLGMLLHERGEAAEAETWWCKAADTGHTDRADAMYNLGVLLRDNGELVEAETWWRKAADTGHTDAMNNLGVLLRDNGELVEAETWWRKAADTGHTRAMNNLAILLHGRGEVSKAETWWRRATDTGDADAMNNLGILLQERGEVAEAETWYRRAADTGHIDAMDSLAILLRDNGELVEAETWWRKAADTGHTDAMNNLGRLFRERGEAAEAETWWRKAADIDHTVAMNNLGILLHGRGALAEAETWWRKAADTGDVGAMYNLGVLLQERGEATGAETWWRKAADTGHTVAMINLGVLLDERGEAAEAEAWYRRAADVGFPAAMFPLANLLHGRGAVEEAGGWWRRAKAVGDPRVLAWFRIS